MERTVMMASIETDLLSSNMRQATVAALADVDALGITGEDRNIVLKALLQARLDELTPTAPSDNGKSRRTPPPAPAKEPGEIIEDGDVLDKMAVALKVSRDTLELVYALQDGEPHVVVSPKKIAANKSQAARQLGQLVAAARQIAGLEEWTSVTVIRKLAQDYGRLDSNNFAASIQQMDNVAVIRGKAQQREVKITKPGYEDTTALIASITGTDS